MTLDRCPKCFGQIMPAGSCSCGKARKCLKCGKIHGMHVENKTTGEMTPLDLCEDCIFEGTHYNHDPNFDINTVIHD